MLVNRIKKRPNLPYIELDKSVNEIEVFQNSVLRPIIKLQHKQLVHCLNYHLKKSNSSYLSFTSEEKIIFIKTIFSKNSEFKTDIRGLVIGVLLEDEYCFYLNFKSQINRRINQIIEQRLLPT